MSSPCKNLPDELYIQLAEAQNWKCGECGGRLNEDSDGKPNYGPYGFTIEHIVLRSKGGPDTWENFAVTHGKCNWGRRP